MCEFATADELADQHGIAASCMTQLLRLKLLAPHIIEALLARRRGRRLRWRE